MSRRSRRAAWPAELAPPTTSTWSPRHVPRLAARPAVVDAAPGQLVDAGRLEAPVLDAGGDDHAVRLDLASVGEHDGTGRAPLVDADDLAHGHHLGAEAPRLGRRPAGEIGAREADREAEVVLDPRALPGLPARGLRARPAPCAAPPRRRRPLRRAPPARRRRPPGRRRGPPARVVDADPLGHLAPLAARWSSPSVREHDDRQRRGPRRRPPRAAARAFGLVCDVEPAVGDVVAREEVAQRVRLAREPVPDDPDPGVGHRGLAPVVEQVVEHRVELLLGRVPRLHQVVVEPHDVDRVDRRLRVGVGGQQHALGGRRRCRAPWPGTRRRSCRACAGRRAAARPAPRAARSSPSSSSACAPDSARSTRKSPPYRRRRSRWTALETPGSSSTVSITGLPVRASAIVSPNRSTERRVAQTPAPRRPHPDSDVE